MTTFLQRIAYWLGWRKPEPQPPTWGWMMGEAVKQYDRDQYLHDFGPNVPVEDLGGKPVFYENNQPVYWEKAP